MITAVDSKESFNQQKASLRKPFPPDASESSHLEHLRDSKDHVFVYLQSGLKLEGRIVSFDDYVIFLTSHKGFRPLMIYKHAIVSIE